MINFLNWPVNLKFLNKTSKVFWNFITNVLISREFWNSIFKCNFLKIATNMITELILKSKKWWWPWVNWSRPSATSKSVFWLWRTRSTPESCKRGSWSKGFNWPCIRRRGRASLINWQVRRIFIIVNYLILDCQTKISQLSFWNLVNCVVEHTVQ